MLDRPTSKIHFKFMKLALWVRDMFISPDSVLTKADTVKSGASVLDYGCGPGNYAIAAAELVGPRGKVYAADVNPLAIREVQEKAKKKGISNINTILTDCDIDVPDVSVDVVLLIYVLHDFKNPDPIIRELNRVLKPAGILVVLDHKFDNEKVVSIITHVTNLRPKKEGTEGSRKGKKTVLIFSKK
jgi:ubiquinone/menaquinone biosynthesis C-methylase UbiE